jgi:putative tricarboxylic transport membrane protein
MLLERFFESSAQIITNPETLMLSVVGVVLGIILGAIPGISSTMTLAILLPISFYLDQNAAMVFLMAVFSSSVFGGSISAILLNIPGTPGAIVTQIDGYPLAKKGKGGYALAFALFSSSVGGLIGLLILMLLAPLIIKSAMNFRSPEFAAAALFGLAMLAYSTPGSTYRGIVVGIIGVLLGMVGFDNMTDMLRFDYRTEFLQNGIDLVPLSIGLFGLSEILKNIESSKEAQEVPKIGKIFPPILDILKTWKSIFRGSIFGVFIGAIPAAGSAIAVAISYAQEVKLAKDKSDFGKGDIRGVVAPESANNACVGGALIPMMTLGIPGDTMTAVLMASLLIHGLQPGPFLFQNNPEFVSTVYASLFIAIIFTFLLGSFLIRFIVKALNAPTIIINFTIIVLCLTGSFAIRNLISDVFIMIFFGILGYLFYKIDLPTAPLAFGLILGPVLEENFRRSLIISRGSWSIFIERPISLCLVAITVIILLLPLFKFKKAR